MGTSSARPDNLEDFSQKSRRADRELQSALRQLISAYHGFQSENQWGVFDADSLLSAFGRYIRGNGFTVRWVAKIAAAFRAAGGSGRIARLPDAAIKASLRAAGLDHDRHSVTFDGPVAFGSPPTTGYTNDPVNTATGNFVEIEHDLLCGGLVEGLSFARTYNSRSDRVGPFGRGWASWAAARLIFRPEGAEYVGPDGQEVVFPRLGDGYGRVPAVTALVEPLDAGAALNWLAGGGRWEFDASGLPVRVSRGPGTEIELRHDAGGRLVELAHGGGRQVRVEWDEEIERIVGLASSDGRRVSYRYDLSGNLVEVEGAAGGRRRYALDQAGRVLEVIDADGVVELVNTYDDDGRVVEQRSPHGRHTHISYLPGRVTVTMDDDEDGPVNTYVHDDAGRLIAVVDGNDNRQSMTYDEWGNLASLTERNGAVTVQKWDDRARPASRVLSSGVELTFSYDRADRLVKLVSSTAAVTTYAYLGDERIPSEITDPEGAITRQSVKDGLVHAIVDPDGVTTSFEFDGDGNVVAATDASGQTTRLEYDDAGRVTATVTPLGRRSTFFYDSAGLLVERQDPAGEAWRYERTAAGRLLSVTDPTGAREEIRYGEHGSPVAVVDPLGHVTTSAYDVFGNIVEVILPDGAAWRYAYDAVMRLTATVDATGARWEREYDPNGTLVGVTDPTGLHVRASLDAIGRIVRVDDGVASIDFEHDAHGRIVAHRRADGTGRRRQLDLCGRMTVFEDATGAITRTQYTPAGRIARARYPSGRVDTAEYDACGRMSAVVDGAGRRSEMRYDADGALIERCLPSGECERFAYDEAGRLRQWEAPGVGVTSYAFDAAGRIVGLSDRETGASRFAYDAAGRLASASDANGATTRYGYDEVGRLVQTVDPLGGTATRRRDAMGRDIEITDELGRSATTAYDAAGRAVEIVDGSGRAAHMTYDVSGRLTSFGPVDGEPTTVAYDALGRFAGLAQPGAPAITLRWDAEDRLVERARGDLALGWSYGLDGERTAIRYPDGTETRYAHDAGGFATGAVYPAIGAVEFERDAVGRLVGAQGEGMRAAWQYDDGDLARCEMHAGGRTRTADIMRDATGRIARATIDGVTHEFAHDAAGQLVAAGSAAGTYEFGYDANGRLAAETSGSDTLAYVYDAAGQLVSRTDAAGAVTRFEYDNGGRRVREHGPDLERSYTWDELGRLAGVAQREGDAGEAIVMSTAVDALGELASLDGTSLLWDTAHPLAPLLRNGDTTILGEGAAWALVTGGAVEWLAPDWQGTVGDMPRDPWGATVGGDVPPTRLGYRGELEFGAETWLRHRPYQPATRSFPTPDPMAPLPGMPASANRYSYAANDPLGRADPLGLRPVTEQELNAIRDQMDRGWAHEAGDGIYEWSSEVSAITGVLALVVTPIFPPAGAALAGVSLVTGVVSGVKAYNEGDTLGVVLDGVGLVGAVAAPLKVVRAGRTASAAKSANVDAAKAMNISRYYDQAGVENQARTYFGEAYAAGRRGARKHEAADALREQAKRIEEGGAGLGVVSAARGRLRDQGGDVPLTANPFWQPSFARP